MLMFERVSHFNMYADRCRLQKSERINKKDEKNGLIRIYDFDE